MVPTFREILTPLFAYVLMFAQTPEEQQRPFAEVRERIGKLIADQRLAVKRHDLSAQDYDTACFAVAAWIDEMVMRYTAGSNRALFDEWRRSPLQAALFHTTNAGEEFFERLGQLNPAQKQLYEVYYLAMALGFRGKYYDPAQENQLIELRRECATHLPVPISDLLDIEKRQEHITPEPYAQKPPSAKPIARPWSIYWLAAPVAVAAVLLLYFFWPSGPDPVAVQNAVRSFDCAQITVSGIDHGVVKLKGHVESDQQREAVREKLRSIRRVKGVSDDLSVIPRPFCEVMEALGPLEDASRKSGFDLKVQPSKGCGATYYNQERLVIDVSADKPLHYTYVDYYTADRATVAHFFPNVYQPDNMIQTSSFTLGAENGSNKWHADVQYPFGTEMVTVVSSPKPLFPQPRPDLTENAEAYLSLLAHQLQADASGAGNDKAAAYCFVTTQEKP